VAPQAAGRRDLSAQTAPMNGDDSVPFALVRQEALVHNLVKFQQARPTAWPYLHMLLE
jgi:hypothetical protein